jgi:hypothetical protein
MKHFKKNATFGGREKARDIRRHPIEDFREYVKAGIFSRLPQLPSEFEVVVAPDQDVIVRFYGRGTRPIEVKCQRDVNGGRTVLADRSIEIELIGAAATNWTPATTAKKRAKSKSK